MEKNIKTAGGVNSLSVRDWDLSQEKTPCVLKLVTPLIMLSLFSSSTFDSSFSTLCHQYCNYILMLVKM